MIVVLVALVVLPVVPVMVLWGLAKVLSGAFRRRWTGAVRGLAMICVALGAGAYLLAVTAVVLEDSEAREGADSSPARVCRQADEPTLTGHRIGYLPPRFDCVREDGTTWSPGVVPGRLAPAGLALTLTGAALAGATSSTFRRRQGFGGLART